MKLGSETYEVANIMEAHEFCYQQGWTDGLPVVPPTQEAIARILEYLGRDPAGILGVVPPRNGVATLEKVAANCVMAGCLPEHTPVVIAALEAVLEEPFNLNGVQTTTHCCAPLVVVSGPAVRTLGFNTRESALGHGSRANAAVGRALRLILWNIGGGYPGEPCKTTHGHPGYYSFCIAEDPDTNRWEALHVEHGFSPEDTTATVVAVEAPHSVGTGAGYSSAEDVLFVLADAIAVLGSNNLHGGDMVLALSPLVAQNLATSGFSKAEVKRRLMALARRPVREVQRHRAIAESSPFHWSHVTDPHDPDAMVPFVRKPENLIIVTTGGWGSGGGFASLFPGWGNLGGLAQTKKVSFPKKGAESP
ncbi:MAG: hypothetical protein HY533_06405 [Chloroflexi bacterium]|nr:hypothetical protein [Chloroflexota bacterium]